MKWNNLFTACIKFKILFSGTSNEKPINRKQKGKNRYKEELNKSNDSIKIEDFDENLNKSDKKLLSILNTNKSSK